MIRGVAAIVALAPVAASAPTLHAGLWRVESKPEMATLDGRRLADLPYVAAAPETVCMYPEEAADPARWFTRETAPGCTFSKRSVAGGQVDIAGECPSATPGFPRGTVRFTGRWSADRYAVRFVTSGRGENGLMGFTGVATGTRIGDCPR